MATLVFACWTLLAGARAQEPAPRPASPPVTVEQLAERLAAMEAMNRKLAAELERSRRDHDEQMRQILEKLGGSPAVPAPASPPALPEPLDPPLDRPEVVPPAPARESVPTGDQDTPVPDYTDGRFPPDANPPGYPLPSQPKVGRSPLRGSFGPGFQLETEDQEFRLQVHYESQIEGRMWSQNEQQPANSGFFLPRQRIFFNGNITKPIEYEFSINRGFGNLSLLNAYINVHFNDKFELRVGRFFTPLPYDQYAISNYWLLTPERSVFTTNLALNRQFGMMAWGYLFEKRLDYAAGIFNGSRNSFESLNNGVDFVGYLNGRPFQESDSLPFLRFLNLGTSVAYGSQDQAAVPQSFRIGGGSPNGDVPGPGTTPFLILNRNVREQGERLIGSVHSAYFYKGLSLIGEYQYGYGNYATPGRASTQVPFGGFYVAGGYFLTGEHVERRTRLIPLRPFIPTNKRDRRGPGAWEVVGRVSRLRLGEEVFDAGFANRDLWSNSATTTEIGMNWYWNEYIKMYAFWLHGDFADPVQYRPGGLQRTADMFWLRFQLYF